MPEPNPDHRPQEDCGPLTPFWQLLRELPADMQLALEHPLRRQLLRALYDDPERALSVRELRMAAADEAPSAISYQALTLERSGLVRQAEPLADCRTMRRRFVAAGDGDPRIVAILTATKSDDVDAR